MHLDLCVDGTQTCRNSLCVFNTMLSTKVCNITCVLFPCYCAAPAYVTQAIQCILDSVDFTSNPVTNLCIAEHALFFAGVQKLNCCSFCLSICKHQKQMGISMVANRSEQTALPQSMAKQTVRSSMVSMVTPGRTAAAAYMLMPSIALAARRMTESMASCKARLMAGSH